MNDYPSILAAAEGLLGEVVATLGALPVRYAIIGGWSAYYLNSHPIGHPGSRDVDVLFEGAAERYHLNAVVERLLAVGYLPSAKHPFQLLRKLSVAGKMFVYNVDILHPSESDEQPEMFVDHLMLPVPESEYRDDMFAVKSIVVPQAAFIFDGHIVNFPVRRMMPNREQVEVTVPLMDEVGLVVTKAQSVNSPKRPRDALDTYLAVSQARDYRQLVSDFKELKQRNRPVFNTLYGLKKALDNRTVVENTLKSLPETTISDLGGHETLTNQIAATFVRFFDDVNLDPKASQA